jgi:NADH-quinone oxidoreductase subunit C
VIESPDMLEVSTRLKSVPGATALEVRQDGWWMQAPLLDVMAMAETMSQLGARLGTMTASALEGGETAVIYHYVLGSAAINLRTQTRNRSLPSIAPVTRAADWIEREIQDLFGADFPGHPNLARLIRPAQVPQGFFRSPKGAPEGTQG